MSPYLLMAGGCSPCLRTQGAGGAEPTRYPRLAREPNVARALNESTDMAQDFDTASVVTFASDWGVGKGEGVDVA